MEISGLNYKKMSMILKRCNHSASTTNTTAWMGLFCCQLILPTHEYEIEKWGFKKKLTQMLTYKLLTYFKCYDIPWMKQDSEWKSAVA